MRPSCCAARARPRLPPGGRSQEVPHQDRYPGPRQHGGPSDRRQLRLARLRLKSLIERVPHTNAYMLTSDGVRVAMLYIKVHNRLLVPLLATNAPPASPDLR